MKQRRGRFGLGNAELGSGLLATLLIMKSSSNIQSYYFLLIGQIIPISEVSTAEIKGHRIRSLLVTFGHLFRLLFEYTEGYINHLIDKPSGSYQEYTIATHNFSSCPGHEESLASLPGYFCCFGGGNGGLEPALFQYDDIQIVINRSVPNLQYLTEVGNNLFCKCVIIN